MNVSNVAEASANAVVFNWIDYASFSSLLIISVFVGIYYGCIKRNQNTVTEYMLAGKNMNTFPIAMSLVTSHVSGITLLGLPAEVYEYGTQFTLGSIVCPLLVIFITNKFYLPVFHSLQLCSVYEYLEMRFSKTVRKLCSFMFAYSLLLYVPVVIYLPALAFSKVTGISLHYMTPVVCFACIFYTTIGGLKTVVWTDTIQGAFTVCATIAVVIIGLRKFDGLENVYRINEEGKRIEFFNFDLNPMSRSTFWSVLVGTTCMWIVALTVHPGSTQRFVALPTLKAAKRSVLFFGIGVLILNVLSALVGMAMYANYAKCDPLSTREVKKAAEIMPRYVQEIGAAWPGLTGLFLSGLTSAALSTMSAAINTLSGTIYEDFIQNFMPKNTTEGTASFVMKILVFLFGTICVLLVYVVEQMGEAVQMSFSLGGAPNGAIFMTFMLGLFFPWANSKGVICGIISSFVFNTWLIVGTQLSIMNTNLKYVGKPSSIEGCIGNATFPNNISLLNDFREVGQGVFVRDGVNKIFATSFLYYVPVGSIIGLVVSLTASILTGGNNLETLDPKLITPAVRRLLPKSANRISALECEYKPVTRGLKLEMSSKN